MHLGLGLGLELGSAPPTTDVVEGEILTEAAEFLTTEAGEHLQNEAGA